ncbi:Glutamate receptor ionotropic, kainate 2 [Frankliniella fusca]|uniref:Glutamate receptor ionotropic, kainate 2 n=1 Tax=Frankliniella fusca TaxID=407009 RepID=A0AAE1HKN1_9NEOP|nr:Glutamate receptor ionotropic, kainate 2 [Frankliniella fusca]
MECSRLLLLGALLTAAPWASGLPREVNIGGLFESTEHEVGVAFARAVAAVNADETILPEVEVVPKPMQVPKYDSFYTAKTVCELMSGGLAGIFGPSSSITSGHVQAVCDTMEVPHVQTLFNPYLNRETCSINLHPHHSTYAEILLRLVDVYGWKDFIILYEDDDSLVRVNRLLEKYDPKGYTVTLRQLPAEDMKPVFREILRDNVKNIIIDCGIDTLSEALRQAQQIGVMGKDFNYIISNLDFHTLDLEPYRYSGTNMTGLRIVRPHSPLVQSAVEAWASAAAMAGETSDLEPGNLRLGPALMWDAVHLFARALERLDQSREVELPALECDDKRDQPGERGLASWDHGFSLINFMRTTEIEGLTGTIRFDNQGFRTDFSLDIIELSPDMESTMTIGNVDLTTFNLTRIERAKDELRRELESVRNQTFRVMIAIQEPYNMLQDSALRLTGNDRYEGFCIDLIKELAQMLGFNYTFIQQMDNAYGSCDRETEVCNGMLGKVQSGEADLAITDLTITFDRARGVDFTKPFMNLGIALLHTVPRPLQPSLFSFLDPFSGQVWVYLLAAYAIVSVEMYVMARIAPAEWTNPYPCIEEPEELENQFSMLNAFWFTIGAIMQQGSEIAPIAPSTRMVAGMWWFFSLIMVSSYTANLAAFLTVTPTEELITDPRQLLNHPKVKYGAKEGGSTYNFFKETTDPTFKEMFAQMENVKDNDVGVRRVKEAEGGYAFFMESSSIEYQAQRECDVRKVGQNLDEKGYGIAMRKNAPYLSALSAAVVKLQESGKLSELRTRWWEQRRGGGKCIGSAGADSSATNELGLENVGGVFLVLGVGVALAVVLAFAELLWDLAVKRHSGDIASFRAELLEELKFILKCSGSTKPVKKAKSEDEQAEDALKDFQPLSPYAVVDSEEGANQNHKEPLY